MTHPSIYRTAGFELQSTASTDDAFPKWTDCVHTVIRDFAPLLGNRRVAFPNARQIVINLSHTHILSTPFFCKALHLLRFKFISSKMTLFTHVLLLYLRSKSGDVFFQSKLPTSRGCGSNPKWEASPLSLDWTYLGGKFFLKFPPWKPLPEKNSAAVPIPREKIFLPVCEVLATATGIYWDCARAIQQKKS